MGHSRLRDSGNAADAHPKQPVDSPCTVCAGSCADNWAAVGKETAQILDAKTPEDRNRNISAAYAEMNLRRPDLKWIGLAAIVSRQAGCAMTQAEDSASNPISYVPAKTAKKALTETNTVIFSDIYPVMRFYEKFGPDDLERCQSAGRKESVDPKLLVAAALQKSGDTQGASDAIAEYEQADIVQTRIYNQLAYKATFTANELAAQSSFGRYFGARPAEVALSSQCEGTPPVPMKGSIGNAKDRVDYYKSLSKEMNGQSDEWRRQTMSDIVRQRETGLPQQGGGPPLLLY